VLCTPCLILFAAVWNLWKKFSGMPEVFDTAFLQATSWQYPLRPGTSFEFGSRPEPEPRFRIHRIHLVPLPCLSLSLTMVSSAAQRTHRLLGIHSTSTSESESSTTSRPGPRWSAGSQGSQTFCRTHYPIAWSHLYFLKPLRHVIFPTSLTHHLIPCHRPAVSISII